MSVTLNDVDPNRLVPTEKIIMENVPNIIQAIGLDPRKWPPIIVSDELYILDGHHRHAIALTHSLERIPAYVISYFDPKIEVFDYNDGTPLDKLTLTKIYRSGVVLPPKTTRHIVEL